MKVTVISDTHNRHAEFGRLRGDVLIHCGDMLDLFDRSPDDLKRVDDWFGEQEFDLILCTGGNHDLLLEDRVLQGLAPFSNATYLQDRKHVHSGVTFYGAPWVPKLKGHAFYKGDNELREKWSQIPTDVDVLITHTPPLSRLDMSSRGIALGCPHLAAATTRVRPKLHCFGHVHNGAGIEESNGTVFVNASSVDSQVNLAYAPRVFEI